MVLEEAVLAGDRKAAWAEVRRLVKARKSKKAHSQLTYIVGKHFWWLAGEWYTVTGFVGWSPGFRDWDIFQSDYPTPLATGGMYLNWFVRDLCTLPPCKDILQLISDAEQGSLASVEADLYRRVVDLRPTLQGREAIGVLYDSSARRGKPDYVLGAARPFLWLSYTKKWWKIGVAGLVLLHTRGIEKSSVVLRKIREQHL